MWKTCPLPPLHHVLLLWENKNQTTQDQPKSRAGGLHREAHSSSCIYIWNSRIQRNPQFVLNCISEHHCWETGSLPCSCRSSTGHHDCSVTPTLAFSLWSHRHLREVAHDSSAEQLGGYESQVLALFPLVPVHPECLIKIQRIKKKSKKAFWGRKFLVSVSKTYSSSVLLKCVYSTAR